MSAWRLAVRALHDLGRPATAVALGAATGLGTRGAGVSMKRAAELGLVRRPGRGCANGSRLWTLTQLGTDWCEGRVDLAVPRGLRAGPVIWRATWVSSLPRGLRLGQPSA